MNPGLSFKFGLSARHATSVPATTDWRKKFARSATREPNLSCDRFGGRRRKLTQVAPATAASPTGRSVNPHPEIMSQKARKSVARTMAAAGQVDGDIIRCRAQGADPGPETTVDAQANQRPRNEPDAAPLLILIARTARHPRSQAPKCCDAGQSYHDSFERGKSRSAALGRGSNSTIALFRERPRQSADHRPSGEAEEFSGQSIPSSQ